MIAELQRTIAALRREGGTRRERSAMQRARQRPTRSSSPSRSLPGHMGSAGFGALGQHGKAPIAGRRVRSWIREEPIAECPASTAERRYRPFLPPAEANYFPRIAASLWIAVISTLTQSTMI
jgi:hypothetical protein